MPFADGELEPALAADVEKALADCPECREELAEIRRVSTASRAAFVAPLERVDLSGVYDGVMARIAAEAALDKKSAGAAAPAQPGLWARFTAWCSEVVRFERPMVLAGAAALALAVVVGVSLSGGSSNNPVVPDPTVAGSNKQDELKPRRGAEGEVKSMGRNTAYVEHLEADKGKAYVEFDKNDPEAPMVLWHVVEDEDGAPVPKGL